MTDWIWIDPAVIPAVHDEQLAEHGGIAGTRDQVSLESVPARPVNPAADGAPDHADLAAAYGHSIARNRPFIDGNKRTAFVSAELFLALNGYALTADDIACVTTMLAVAAGELDEKAFADWIRTYSQKR